VQDILRELEKPGRDPRPEFKTASFRDGVEDLRDLQPGMLLEGAVTNVTNFGAFVDIGVHQDGLVHVSALANRFVKDPHDVVKAGDVVKVKVLEVDAARKRIALTMRLTDELPSAATSPRPITKVGAGGTANRTPGVGKSAVGSRQADASGAMAAAFAKLGPPPGRPKADPPKARERSEPRSPLLPEKGSGDES
jgi:uncharacterized protein